MLRGNKLENVEHDGIVPVKVFYFKKKEGPLAKIVMPHWHRDIELDYLVKGNTVMVVRGERKEVEAGEVMLINSGVIHSSVRSRKGNEEESIAFLIDYDYMKRYFKKLDDCCFCETFTQEQQAFLRERMLKTAKTYLSDEPFKELKTTRYMLEIMIYLLENCVDEMVHRKSPGNKRMHNISKAIEYIDKNYSQNISLETMREYLGMDGAYFSRCFKKVTGECFKDYLQKKRLSMSLKELTEPGKTVTDIAYKYGFPNLKSYITAFKKYYLVTPKKYIRLQMENDENFLE